MFLLVLALAAISVVPPYQGVESYQGLCSGKMTVFVPPHKDNREVEITISYGDTAPQTMRYNIDPNRGESYENTFTMGKGSHWTVSAWVMGPNRVVRGASVGVIECL